MFINKYEDIRKLIQTHIYDNWKETRIQYSNFTLDPIVTPEESWVKIVIVFGKENCSSICGEYNINRGTGYFDIEVFVPINTGTGLLDTLAAHLNDLFISFRKDSFRVKNASYKEGFMEVDTWFKGVLTFYFDWEYKVI